MATFRETARARRHMNEPGLAGDKGGTEQHLVKSLVVHVENKTRWIEVNATLDDPRV